MKKILVYLCCIFCCSCVSLDSRDFSRVLSANQSSDLELVKVLNFDTELVKESSGLVASSVRENSFFTHSDSFNRAELELLTLNDDVVDVKKFKIDCAFNFDWEDIASDGKGVLFIADTGDNWRIRDLKRIYCVSELELLQNGRTKPFRVIKFRYKRDDFSSFVTDCEACYFKNDKLYLFSKEAGVTSLFVLPLDSKKRFLEAERVSSAVISDKVTAVDVSDDGKVIALLTYSKLYLMYENYAKSFDLDLGQCEAVAFGDSNTIYISNESGSLYVYKIR